MNKFLVCLFAILLGSCVNVETIQHHTLPQVRPDKALIYFYREGRFEGSAVGYHIFESGQELGSMRNGSFFHIYAVPGEHIYELHVPLSSAIQRRINVVAGKTYYLQIGLYVGGFSSNLTFNVMNDQDGAAALDHLSMTNSP